MTYRPRASCRRGRVTRAAAGRLSRTGLCPPCSEEALADALAQLAGKSGPVFRKYRDGVTDYAASLWGASDIPPTPAGITGVQLQLEEITK